MLEITLEPMSGASLLPCSLGESTAVKSRDLIPVSTEVASREESVFVDSDAYSPDIELCFDIMVDGKRVGDIKRYPEDMGKAWGHAFWAAHIAPDTSGHYVIGTGRTPDAALADALEDGVHRLRETAAFAAKIGMRIKRNPKRVSFKLQQDGK